MNPIALHPKVEYTITIQSGPDKGTTFKIMSPTIKIGRSSDNDISLPRDLRCSRNHATIHISKSGILIKSLNKGNLVKVDSKEGNALILKHNSILKVGSTKLLFQISMIVPNSTDLDLASAGGGGGIGPARPNKDLQYNSDIPVKKVNHLKFILIGFLVLILLFFLTQQQSKKNEAIKLATEKEIQAQIENMDKIREAEKKIFYKKGLNTPQFKQAQALYVKGFRDFRKGQFERATSSFEACIAIFPKHELCATYKKLTEKKFQELIQYHMILGKKYMDKSQYQACLSSLKNVMFMVKDRTSRIYKEANSIYKLCKSRLKGRY